MNMNMDGFPNYGLEKGDHITILKGSGCEKEPDWIEVIKEYPDYILCRFWYRHWTGRRDSYTRSLNKALIVSGDISFQKET